MTSLSFPGNVSFAGTVTSPLFVSNQQIIAPFAAGTLSTLSVGSFASTYSNVLQAFAASLTVGTGTAGSFSSTFLQSNTLNVSGSMTAAGNTFGNVSGKSYLYNAGHISNFAGAITDVGPGNVGVIFTTGGILDLVNSSTTSMLRIAGTNVGLNNINPQYTFDVNGSQRISSASVPAAYVYTSGNNTRLQIDGANAWQSGIAFQSSGAESAVLYRPANSTDQRMYLSNAGDLVTWTNSSPGKVGILNTNPSYTLDVAGSCRITGTFYASLRISWTTLSLSSGTSTVSGMARPQYCVDELGYMRLRGAAVTTSANGATMFLVPYTFTYQFNLSACFINSSNVYSTQPLIINTTGKCIVSYGGPGTYSFDNICLALGN